MCHKPAVEHKVGVEQAPSAKNETRCHGNAFLGLSLRAIPGIGSEVNVANHTASPSVPVTPHHNVWGDLVDVEDFQGHTGEHSRDYKKKESNAVDANDQEVRGHFQDGVRNAECRADANLAIRILWGDM